MKSDEIVDHVSDSGLCFGVWSLTLACGHLSQLPCLPGKLASHFCPGTAVTLGLRWPLDYLDWRRRRGAAFAATLFP